MSRQSSLPHTRPHPPPLRLPFPRHRAEYWPEPQRGICEAYRVVRPGGLACMIGPVHPTFPLSRAMADLWMLFPTEEEYIQVRWGACCACCGCLCVQGAKETGYHPGVLFVCLFVCFGGGGGGGRLQVGCVRG